MVTICEGYMALLGLVRCERFLLILIPMMYVIFNHQYLFVQWKYEGRFGNIQRNNIPNVGSNFMTLSVLILVTGCCQIMARIQKRLREHCALLLVLWEKSSHMKELAMTTLESCFPPIIVEWLESQATLKGDQYKALHDQASDNEESLPTDNIGVVPSYAYKAYKNFVNFHECIRNHARSFSLLHPLPDQTNRLYKYVKKPPCIAVRSSGALIAIKYFNTDSTIHIRGIDVIFEKLEAYANKYGIIPIREYGNTWIGVCGFFEMENDEDDKDGDGRVKSSR